MKKLFKILVIIACSFTLQSCEKDCEKDMEPENKDFYYAKFEAVCLGAYHYVEGYARAGEYSVGFGYLTRLTRFETILGPIKYGDRASISGGVGAGSCSVYISKNNGPFALKASGKTGASYTIDF